MPLETRERMMLYLIPQSMASMCTSPLPYVLGALLPRRRHRCRVNETPKSLICGDLPVGIHEKFDSLDTADGSGGKREVGGGGTGWRLRPPG